MNINDRIPFWGIVVVVVFSSLVLIGATWLSMQFDRKPRDHLCAISEISPDMTQYERDRCRKLRIQK